MSDETNARDLFSELPLTTVESFIAAVVEAGPEVAEHMTRAAQELLLAAHALVAAAERNLVEQRRLREEAAMEAAMEAEMEAAGQAAAESAAAPDTSAGGSTLRSV